MGPGGSIGGPSKALFIADCHGVLRAGAFGHNLQQANHHSVLFLAVSCKDIAFKDE